MSKQVFVLVQVRSGVIDAELIEVFRTAAAVETRYAEIVEERGYELDHCDRIDHEYDDVTWVQVEVQGDVPCPYCGVEMIGEIASPNVQIAAMRCPRCRASIGTFMIGPGCMPKKEKMYANLPVEDIWCGTLTWDDLQEEIEKTLDMHWFKDTDGALYIAHSTSESFGVSGPDNETTACIDALLNVGCVLCDLDKFCPITLVPRSLHRFNKIVGFHYLIEGEQDVD